MGDFIQVSWKGNMQFVSKSNEGEINLDASPESGGNNEGLRPKSLMLSSLAGCTGMDITSLIKKMRLNVADMKIEAKAELTNEHPKIYKSTHLVYTFKGDQLEKDKLKKIVDLSIEKYCGVYEMFRAFSEMSFEIIFDEQP